MPGTTPGPKPHDSLATKSITYTAGGTGAAGTATAIFTVTGEVIVLYLVAFCTTDLTESAGTPTLALGVVGSTSLFVAATTATVIDASEFWVDTGPDANGIAIPAGLINIAITDNVQCLVGGTNNISDGVIRYDIYWRPLSSDGNVVAA